MRFEARELPEGAEPISTTSVTRVNEGEVYFSVQYLDEGLLTPITETWVFVGRNLDNGSPDLYFQDAGSYWAGIRFGSKQAVDAQFQCGSEGKIFHIFEYEQALNELMKCSLRRRKLHR